MGNPLAPLRRHLDLMPSPLPDTPGLLLRDPFRYSESVLVLPPPLVPCLLLFDGGHDEGDLRALLARITESVEVGDLSRHIRESLSASGFLEDEVFARLRDERHRVFEAGERREAAHAGSAYPADGPALADWAAGLLAEAEVPAAGEGRLVGIAAPHVSPDGGRLSYASAYRALPPALAGRTFVVLGTSHYGAPGRFGLTRKPFATPLGVATVDAERIARLAAEGGPAVVAEDYCHAVEHSIEFQVVMLQQVYGPGVRVAPVLCGPLGTGAGRTHPREDADVQRFLAALRGTFADDVVWVAGIDMAHVGQRYGDRGPAVAWDGPLAAVAERDRERCAAIEAADPDRFWGLVEPDADGDPLRWCGSSAVYALLSAARPRRGALLRYEQWNIDPRSVVTFGGFTFHA